MPRRSTSPASATAQTTLAPGAWPFGVTRPAAAPSAEPAPEAPAAPAETPSAAPAVKRATVTFANVQIQKDVPIPSRIVRSTSAGEALLQSMAPGDMVRLSEAQAKSLGFAARRAGIKITTRRLSGTELGVWRLK